MYPHLLGVALQTQFTATMLEVADQRLLLGVHRNRRLVVRLERLDLCIDVLELGIAVRVAGALPRLAVGLQAEVELIQQPTDQLVVDLEALFTQGFRQATPNRAARHPGGRCRRRNLAARASLAAISRRAAHPQRAPPGRTAT